MNPLLAPQVKYDRAETESALARPLPDCRGGRRFLHALGPISRQVFTKPTASRGLKPAYRSKALKTHCGLSDSNSE
jgi:hypothetical protein